MRWNRITTPRHGDTRKKTFFAWLPIKIKSETRWMEVVYVEEIYYDYAGWSEPEWSYLRFLN